MYRIIVKMLGILLDLREKRNGLSLFSTRIEGPAGLYCILQARRSSIIEKETYSLSLTRKRLITDFIMKKFGEIVDKPKAGDKPEESDSSSKNSGDFLRIQTEEVEHVRNTLKEKEAELFKIETLESIEEVSKALKEANQLRGQAEQHIASLRKEATTLQRYSDSLSGKSPGAQKIILEKAQSEVDPKDTKDKVIQQIRQDTKNAINKAIQQVQPLIKPSEKPLYDAVLGIEKLYPIESKKTREEYRDVRHAINAYMQGLGIEITSYHFSEPSASISINSFQEFKNTIKEVEKAKKERDLTKQKDGEELAQKRSSLQSTRFYREKIVPMVDAGICHHHRKELEKGVASFADFINNPPPAEHLLDKVNAQIAQLKESRKELQEAAEDVASSYPSGTIPEEGFFSQAIRQYEALLGLHQAIKKAIEPRQTASQTLDPITRPETVITVVCQPKETVMEYQQSFQDQYARDTRYNLVTDMYEKALAAYDKQEESHTVLEQLNNEVKEYNRKVPQVFGQQHTNEEMQDFQEKLQAFINMRMAGVAVHGKRDNIKVKAIIDYYYALARQPLQEQISDNRKKIKKESEGVVRTSAEIENQKQQMTALASAFQKQAGINLKTITPSQRQKLLKQQSSLEKEVSELTEQLDKLEQKQELDRQKEELKMLLRLSKLQTSTVADRSSTKVADRSTIKVTDSKITKTNREALKNRKVKKYADLLSSTFSDKYPDEYLQKFDINQAIESASFLSEQKFVSKKPERYVAVAAHILHEFGVSFNSLRLNSETYEIEIAQTGDKKAGKQPNSEALSINRDGVLQVGDKRLKASVLATEEGTHTWILSVRAKQAYGKPLFAAETVMSQSGGVDFEDLIGLTRGNKNITALAAAREFREEAPGYDLVPDTLQRVRSPETSTDKDHVIFFRAHAREAPSSARSDIVKPEVQETTGIFRLDVLALIKKYQLDEYNFFDQDDRSRVMEAILDEASNQRAIVKLNEPRKHDYFASYNVRHMVDDIGDTIKTLSGKVQWKFVPPTFDRS